ncbi:MAG: hypothetical protein JST46_03975 [Bacteroidetes bacterium]|nr:hypothetical protein [Bacteroidota bacterium]
MPHIPGHIDTSNQSFGLVAMERTDFLLLSLDPDPSVKDTLKKKTDVHFLPYYLPWGANGFITFAGDIVVRGSNGRSPYDDAEEWLEASLQKLPPKNTGRIEDSTRAQINALRILATNADSSIQPHIHKILNYLSGPFLDRPYSILPNDNAVIKFISDNSTPVQRLFSSDLIDRIRILTKN